MLFPLLVVLEEGMVSQAYVPQGQDRTEESIAAAGGGNRSVVLASTEAAWIAAALRGDLNAFNNLVMAHQDSLYGWVLSLVRDEALADDLTQAAFLRAYQKLRTFRGGSFRAWLFAIARNCSFDELRREQRQQTVSLDDAGQDERDRLEILPDDLPLPEEALLAREQAAAVEALFTHLPEAFQQVLRLVDIEGMDYQEAGAVLMLPIGTIKSRLSRARLKMRELLAHHRLM